MIATLRMILVLPLVFAVLCYARLFNPDLWEMIEGSDQ